VSQTRNDILLLGSDNPTTWIVYNSLVQEFGPFKALIEHGMPKRRLFFIRVRKLGLLTALSQLGFIFLIRPWLRRAATRRIESISRQQGLEATPPISRDVVRVSSVNAADCHAHLKEARPRLVIVNGTRILTAKTLTAIDALFINTHQGITPRYRGAHGAYWALHEGDPAHCGVTIHIVDPGIDTGDIIAQTPISAAADDNFVSYPFLQTAAALPLLVQATRDALNGKLESSPVEGESAVWYHPGIFGYLRGRLRGVR
jgi:folate-dependent phosphoribosylglycinamide formyltransferase PurN